ncbi:peptidase of plants and bacteria-domain-containing protein [Diaporthe sp. PMI_573]|nr:peptidase of plants and bacteria-domain-containing protein [Diaporthaceae sp. PMI_573]
MTRNPPPTSAVPSPSSIFMPPTSSPSTGPESRPTATTAEPTPTPLPRRRLGDEEQQQEQQDQEDSGRSDDGDDDTFPLPKLRLHIQDAMHPGASRFLAAVDAPALLSRSVQTVLRLLYVSPQHHKAHDDDGAEADSTTVEQQQQHPASTTTSTSTRRRPARPHYTPPPTRSVTLFLEDMDGVAYTKGMDLDGDHKEIHLSMGYVKGIRRAPTPSAPTTTPTPTAGSGDIAGAYEIEGVLVHELVHCFQYNGRGRCPGGLVEGIADWVRLSARLGAPHWSRGTVPERWDQGYERTAYFLDWLEGRFGRGTVRRMNEALRVREYKQSEFWTGLFGHDVDVLWKEYLKTLKKDGRD